MVALGGIGRIVPTGRRGDGRGDRNRPSSPNSPKVRSRALTVFGLGNWIGDCSLLVDSRGERER